MSQAPGANSKGPVRVYRLPENVLSDLGKPDSQVFLGFGVRETMPDNADVRNDTIRDFHVRSESGALAIVVSRCTDGTWRFTMWIGEDEASFRVARIVDGRLAALGAQLVGGTAIP